MDAQIRRLLVAGAEKNDIQLLSDAFNKLKQNFQVNLVQSNETIGQDIYVLLAESALNLNAKDIADECLQMFFSSSPVKSQFVGRAYLCQFRMYMPTTMQDFASLNHAVPFLEKCLTFASASSRYQFLIYNASVIYFSCIRPFLRQGYRQYLCHSLQQVVDTLVSVHGEEDYAWQAQLLFELVRCYVDASEQDKQRQTSVRLLRLCKARKLPLLSDVLQYFTTTRLMDPSDLLTYVPTSDPTSTFNRLLIDLGAIHCEIREHDATRDPSTSLKDLFDRVMAVPLRSATTGNRSAKATTSHESHATPLARTLTSYDKHRLLVEMGNLALLSGHTDLAKVILDALSNIRLKEPEYLLEVRLMQAEYMVKNLGDNEESYSKSAVDTRCRAIELAEETLESLMRTEHYEIVQTGCIVLWKLCLPLLQTNLRGRIRKALTTLVHLLEHIQSLNWLVRSQAHFELAKIEEDIEQLDPARNNLMKARHLDDTGIYSSRIDLALERLRLRCELYKTPESVDDRVGAIIEQAGKTIDGNRNKQRALLLEACSLLAPDAFQVVLDSENPNAVGKMRAHPTAQLKGFAEHFEKCLESTVHYERVMTESDQDKRLKLWADLAMIARRQEIWDLCRTAARFCLLYDNEARRVSLRTTDGFQRDLVRILAEVHFIAGEAEIEFIRERKIELFDTPNRPPLPTVPFAQRVQVQQESDSDWKHYCQWLQQLSHRACTHFATSATLGELLNEPWLACRAGEYLWNYTRHLFYSNRLRFIIEPLSAIVNALKQIGYERKILLLVNLSVALATAYSTAAHISREDLKTSTSVEPTVVTQSSAVTGRKTAKAEHQASAGASAPTGSSSLAIRNDDVKTALDICEYAIAQTNASTAGSVAISIRDRQTLLQLWITIKLQLQQPVASSESAVLGDEEENTSSLNTLSRAVIAVDLLGRLDNGWHENKDGMSLKQTVTFVDQCVWADALMELQLWCRLGIVANRANDIETTLYARDKTLELIALFQTLKVEKFQLSLANEYVSRACVAHAECSLKQQTGQKQERKEILAVLVEAASYASKADLYELTMHIARDYWNTCRASIKRKLERSLLFDSINELIHHINTVAPKSIVANVSDKEAVQEKATSVTSFKPKKQPLTNRKDKKNAHADDDPSASASTSLSPQEDAQIRSALYGVLVQIFMDKHSWHSALDVIDSALQVLPRTQHRLLLYKYRVLIKSKLGLSITMDMQKFREQGELALARMWRQVAVMTKKRDHVVNAYQYAIATLQSAENYWTKIDLILELASWLYSNEYLADSAIDLIEWAIDLLLTSPSAYQQGLESTDIPDPEKSRDRSALTNEGELGSDADRAHMGAVKPKVPNRQLPDLSINDITEVRRLEYLCRCHVLLAFATRRNKPDYKTLLEKAYWFLTRLWQRGLADSNDIHRDVELDAAAAIANASAAGADAVRKQARKDAAGSASKKKPTGTLATGKSTDKPLPGKTGSLFDVATPKTLSEWALFVPSDDLLHTFTVSQAKQRGLNKHTLPKPLLSFYCLDIFVGLLHDYGYTHLSLPVLSFMRLIGQTLLKSSSIRTYVLLRIQQVCQELNLLQPMQAICQLSRPFTIRDDDLAASRADMMVYSKLLAQQREDETQFDTAPDHSSRMKSEVRSYGTSAYSSFTSKNQGSEAKNLVADLPGDRPILSKIITRHIWLQTATVLFELHFIQEAKEMLQEILNQAVTYDDQTCEKRACILLSEIALYEHRFDQAIELAMQGQQIPLDEHDWYRSVVTVIEALRQDTQQDSYKKNKVRSLLDTSIQRLESIAQSHVNKILSIAYAASLLTSKRIDVDAQDILNSSTVNTTEDKSTFYRLHGILQQYDLASTNMLNLDRYHDACEIVLSHSIPIWKRFARDASNVNERRAHLCQALSRLEQFTELLAARWHAIRRLISPNELLLMQLPIQRQFIRVQLESIGISLDLLKIYAHEMFNERVRRKKTHATSLAVEDFVGKDSEKNDHDAKDNDGNQWSQMIKTLPDKLIASIMAAYEMINSNDKTAKAKILFYLAQVYFTLGQNVGTDYPLEWNAKIKDALAKLNEFVPEKAASKRTESRNSASLHPTATTIADHEWMSDELLAEVTREKADLTHSMSYLGQSMEFALQALNIALATEDKMLIRDSSLLLCDTVGQFDPMTSIVYLSLSQTASASMSMERVLREACHVPSDSELASLFALIDRMKRDRTLTNANNGIVYRAMMERLKTYWPWKYLTIRPQYYDLAKDIPAAFNFLILHYSPDSEMLYAALFNSKLGSGKGATSQGNSKHAHAKATGVINGLVHPQIMKVRVEKRKLDDLLKKFELWKQDYAQILQRFDLKLQHSRERQAMLNSEQVKKALESSSESSSKRVPQADPVDNHSIDKLKERFLHEIVPQLNEYFAPIRPLFSAYLESEKQYEARSSLSADHLILLLDPRLAHLPLESLDLFKHVQIGGIARDFSLQSICNRLNPTIGLDESTIPGEGNKKPVAKEGAEVTSECKLIDAANTFYFIEPILLKSSPEHRTSTPFDSLRQRFPQLMAKWKTIKQEGSTIKSQKSLPLSEQRLSTGELERMLSDAQALLYCGAHTLSDLVGPYKCPTLSKNGCTLLCSFDRTSTSLVHVSASSTADAESIRLDRSTEIAILWTLGGIKSILLNQWKSTMSENEDIIMDLFTSLTTFHCSLGQALRLHVYPDFHPVELDPTLSKDPKAKGTISIAKKARSPSPKGKHRQTSARQDEASSKTRESLLHPSETIAEHPSMPPSEPIKKRHEPTLQLQRVNAVIFGLPNLTFTS